MHIVTDQNALKDAVKRLELDDRVTGLTAGVFVVSEEIEKRIYDFLNECAKKSNNYG